MIIYQRREHERGELLRGAETFIFRPEETCWSDSSQPRAAIASERSRTSTRRTSTATLIVCNKKQIYNDTLMTKKQSKSYDYIILLI